MNGTNQLVLYLDFDGVLHHENCYWHPARGAFLVAPERYSLFQHALLLEQLLEPYPSVSIVLSTSWVIRYGCSKTAKRLPKALQARVVGATFHSRHMLVAEFRNLPRGQQVFDDVLRRSPLDWIALDDNAEGWPTAHINKYVQTHKYEGLSDPDVQAKFKSKLREMCG